MKKTILAIILITHALAPLQAMDPINNSQGSCYVARTAAAYTSDINIPYYDVTIELPNGDEVPPYAGMFTKGLEHDATTGILTVEGQLNYQRLLTALASGQQDDYDAIERAGARKFVSPQGSCALSLQGVPSCMIPVPECPSISSDTAAADMIQDYLQAICRDVRFADYGTGVNTDLDTINGGSITNNAAAVLTALGNSYQGPKSDGIVTANVLFRGLSDGDLVGPYMSTLWYMQVPFFFQPVPNGIKNTLSYPQYVPVAQQREFGVSWDDFVVLQNGDVPRPYDQYDFDGARYIITGRDLATCVHVDGPGEYYFYFANILCYNNFPLSPVFPYNNGDMPNEDAFVNMAKVDMYHMIMAAASEGLKHAWAHKWRGNRRLRPEAMAGLVHQAKVTETNPYNLSSLLFDELGGINLLNWVKEYNLTQTTLDHNALTPEQANTYLLGQVYPEASPMHPSRNAGHATVAAACSTILKAFFDDTVLIKDHVTPMKPNPEDPTTLVPLTVEEGRDLLTLAGELDKSASNIALGRTFAGVHFPYTEADLSSFIDGENLAIALLQDQCRIYTEQDFTGFELTKRDGTRVRITATSVTPLS